MKSLIPFIIASSLLAQSPDAKRNAQMQKLTLRAKAATAEADAFLKRWQDDCEAGGQQLGIIGASLIGCVAKPQPPPLAAVPAPSPSVAEQKEKDAQIDAQAKSKLPPANSGASQAAPVSGTRQ